MAKISHDVKTFDQDKLLSFGYYLLKAYGMREEDAKTVASLLVDTSLCGTDSHGLARLPHYISRIQAGGINGTPEMKKHKLGGAIGILDGDDGLGHLVVNGACDFAVELARESGAGWVAIRNSSHCGALAPFGLKLAREGMIGFIFSHVDPMVLPHGSTQPYCGTNPLCITAPANDEQALCLDIATSIVPWNLVMNAATEGVSIPQGWAVDKDGKDTTDPKAVNALYPFGQHKGSGLGIMIDVLCSLLSDSPSGPDIPKMYGDSSQRRSLGGLVGAIRIDGFIEPERFRQRATQMMQRLNALPPAEGVDHVLYPGEIEMKTRRQRAEEGIPLGLKTIEELNTLAAKQGLELLS